MTKGFSFVGVMSGLFVFVLRDLGTLEDDGFSLQEKESKYYPGGILRASVNLCNATVNGCFHVVFDRTAVFVSYSTVNLVDDLQLWLHRVSAVFVLYIVHIRS